MAAPPILDRPRLVISDAGGLGISWLPASKPDLKSPPVLAEAYPNPPPKTILAILTTILTGICHAASPILSANKALACLISSDSARRSISKFAVLGVAIRES